MVDAVLDIIRTEILTPPTRVSDMMDEIECRHKDRILAFIYYGSSLREIENPEKMLDFYVLIDDYSKVHKSKLRAWLNKHIPPAVYYAEREDAAGVLSTCKYSLMTLDEFERRCGAEEFHSQIWGRFSQPCVLLRAKTEKIAEKIYTARAKAVRYMISQSAPLLAPRATATEIWSRGFYESYRTELRPESSIGRSREIVEQFADRYETLTEAIYGPADADGYHEINGNPKALKSLWRWRRIRGKLRSILRITHGALTFDGGLDYVLRKLENHSGVKFTPTMFQRSHPILTGPIMAYKLWRLGAFR